MSNSEMYYTWNFQDTKHRSPMWYIIALSLAWGLIIFWFLSKQYGMSIVLLLIIGLYFFLENNTDDEVSVQITNLGINVQGSFYDYSRIQSFRFIYDGGEAIYLRINIKKSWISSMNIRVDNDIVANIRPILVQYIEEDAKSEITLLEKIIHTLKL